jgi:outer membrane biosynthesis protein TonB
MPRRSRLPLIVALLALTLSLAACESFDIDKLTDFEIFNTKKKLPGDRKPVFPDGVPGVTQGVPEELKKGYQPPPDAAQTGDAQDAQRQQNAQAQGAGEQPAAKPKPKKQAKVAKPKPQPQPESEQQDQLQPARASSSRAQPQQQPPQQQQTDWPSPGTFSR